MSKLSEEEIIKMLKEYSATNPFQKNMFYVSNLHEAIQGLLDLYNKEKRNHQMTKNNYQGLISDVSTITEKLELEEDATIDEILEKINKEKEKNERLVDRTIKYDNTLEHLQRDTISKDKIKEIADDYESKGYIEIAGAMRELLEERN